MNYITYDDYFLDVSPSKFNVSFDSVKGDDTFTSESGVDNENVVRQTKYTIDIEYKNITNIQLDNLLSYINKSIIDVDFYFGSIKNGQFKSKSIKTNFKVGFNNAYGQVDSSYWDVSFSLEEF